MTQDISVLAPASIAPCDIGNLVNRKNVSSCFHPDSLAFLRAVSKSLVSATYKDFPELVALGFWLRKFTRECEKTSLDSQLSISKPLGCVVHFTPTNVDTMFFYSWACGLVMGNFNIIRVATVKTAAQDLIFELLNQMFTSSEYERVGQTNVFVQYDKQSHWTETLSQFADARVIWGGDQSVSNIRLISSKPRCRDICFADRISAAVINSDSMSDNTLKEVAECLWSDSKLYMQQACSSPKLLLWRGCDQKYERFIRELGIASEKQHHLDINTRNEQLVAAQAMKSIGNTDFRFEGNTCVVSVKELSAHALLCHTGHYVFIVIQNFDLNDVDALALEKLQTLSYAGYDKQEIVEFVKNTSIHSIDRVVPIGSALEFNPIWDGYKLLESLSRHVQVA